MNAIKQILKWTLICLLAFTSFNFFISSDYKVERSIKINTPSYLIYNQVSDLRNWPNWAIWWEQDTTLINEYLGANSGVGAITKWNGKEAGNGSITITECNFEGMKTSLDFGGMKADGAWQFEAIENGTKVTWSMSGEMPFFMRFFTLFFDNMIGPDYEKGLSNLKELCEALPSKSS